MNFPVVIHQWFPPSTGAQKCDGCGGWVTGAQMFWTDNNGTRCLDCFKREFQKQFENDFSVKRHEILNKLTREIDEAGFYDSN